jgi:hypothetical protein
LHSPAEDRRSQFVGIWGYTRGYTRKVLSAIAWNAKRDASALTGKRWNQQREEDQLAREERLLSGLHLEPTEEIAEVHCRANGRTYHEPLSRTFDFGGRNGAIGRRHGDATKAVKEIAYRPEPK